MKKITIMGIAAGLVLAVGILANVGLFGNNALAAEPSMEQRIKTMFLMITNKEFGLKEIKNEIRNIEGDVKDINTKLDGKPDIKHVTGTANLNGARGFDIEVSCDENFQVKSVFARLDSTNGSVLDISYGSIRAFGDFDGTGSDKRWFFVFTPFDPGILRLEGHELISSMEHGRPIGIPANGLFIIRASSTSEGDADDTANVGAVVDVAQTATCDLDIVPFIPV